MLDFMLLFNLNLWYIFDRYRWEKNGKPFNWQVYDNRISQQPGRGSLVITNPQAEDTGEAIYTEDASL